MRHGLIVKLWKVKLSSDAKIDEDIPVSMKVGKCVHEELKCQVGVNGVLGKVQEVQEGTC